MKIDYTLPALQPDTIPDLTLPQESSPSFRNQLTGVPVQVPVSWEQQLRLDARPFTATYLAPPKRPNSVELSDPQTQRVRWRNMLWRHSNLPQPLQPGAGQTHRSIHTMLDMLVEMQKMEDSITSLSVAVSRG